jgi:hypothetical protein
MHEQLLNLSCEVERLYFSGVSYHEALKKVSEGSRRDIYD